MWWAIFDFEYEKKTLLAKPELYQPGMKDERLSTKIFWLWNLYGGYQAIMVLVFCLMLPDESPVPNGKQYSMWPGGMMIFFATVLIANTVWLRMVNNAAFWGELFCFLQTTAYLWFTYLWSILITTSVIYYFWSIYVSSPVAWLGLLLCVSTVGLTDYIAKEVWYSTCYWMPERTLMTKIIRAEEDKGPNG